jgi:hypothetical protein
MSERNESREVAAAAAGRCPACGEARPDLSSPCPACGAAPLGPAEPARPAPGSGRTSSVTDALMQVRTTDIEPYIGLRYLSKLFRIMAVLLIIVMVAEIILGLVTHGSAVLLTILREVVRYIVFAGLFWGAGDLAILMIDIGHDVRAARILIGRQAAHHLAAHHNEPHQRSGERTPRT